MFTTGNSLTKYIYEKPLNFNMREFSLTIGVAVDDTDKISSAINYLQEHETDELRLCFKSIAGDTTLTLNSNNITFNLIDIDSPTTDVYTNTVIEDEKVEVMFSVKRSKNIDLNLARALSDYL